MFSKYGFVVFLFWAGLFLVAESFSTVPTIASISTPATTTTTTTTTTSQLSSTAAAEVETPATDSSSIPPSRFVVQNRFRVKKGREAAFEKRWADRESRLGTLPGFRFFCMLRRVDKETNTCQEDEDNDPNYVSCTVWENFENFQSWRKGDAFKEAHGGGTVKGVISMLAATARNTKGKPKPAYWGGLLPETVEGKPPSDGEGWRTLESDGTKTLPTECFVAMNKFSVMPNMESAFEAKFATRESTLKEFKGFRGFLLLRRDGKKQPGDGGEPDDGYTHSTFSVWDEQANFDEWMASNSKKETKKPPAGAAAGGPPSPKGGAKGGPPKIYSQPPKPMFYQGFLLLESKDGV